MYAAFLLLHSWIRWIALVAGVAATVSAWGADDRGSRGDRWGLILTICMDLQLVIGLLLYFVVSPTMEAIRGQMGEAMRNPQLRFFAVEHVSAMFVALVLVHVGRVLARKAATPSARRTRLVVCYGLATLIMILSTPWPGLPYGRPLFRF
jgi:heme A synthase